MSETAGKVELLYDVRPEILKPTIDVQGKLVQLVKREAARRVSMGESLRFRFGDGELLEIDVSPANGDVSLPGREGAIEFVVRRKESPNANQHLMKQVEGFLLTEVTYPSDAWRERYERLVGLREIKQRMLTSLHMLFSDEVVTMWAKKHHCGAGVGALMNERYPVYILEGQQGVGKSELMRSIGDPLARVLGREVVAYQIGLQVRGEGLVGQMSQNIARVIEFGRMQHEARGIFVLLLMDEADAIGQERGGQRQHHEDSAGVNTLLQQIDTLRDTPGVALLFSTNRHGALDKALKGRTNANLLRFSLPDYGSRYHLLYRMFYDTIDYHDLQELARETAGFSPRDIVEACRSACIEAVCTDSPVTAALILQAAETMREGQNGKGYTNGQVNIAPREALAHGNGRSVQKVAVSACHPQ